MKFSNPLEELIHLACSEFDIWVGDCSTFGLVYAGLSIDHSSVHRDALLGLAADHGIDILATTSFEGHYLITENSDGIVHLTRYPTHAEREAVMAELDTVYSKFLEGTDHA